MRCPKKIFFWLFFLITVTAAAQTRETPLRIFGYFQDSFEHRAIKIDADQNFFNLQQLNLFFQKDLAQNWRAFVNLEFLNNFSSNRQWGSAKLDEAWVRYRVNEKFNLKLGLLIPVFNHLNEIKNRTPLLPYIIRPIAYETSFEEFVAVEDYTPERAFVQVYGFFPFGETKFDYAVYLGNSPNINNNSEIGQTGVDSTDTFLGGGRIGLRVGELKFGFSFTRDNSNLLQQVEAEFPGGPAGRFNEVPRTRFGGDLSYHLGKLSFEAELIDFKLANESELDLERSFYYGTLGYQVTERFYTYASFWKIDDALQVFDSDVERLKMKIPTFGASFKVNDRIALKGQVARAQITAEAMVMDQKVREKEDIDLLAFAASIFF